MKVLLHTYVDNSLKGSKMKVLKYVLSFHAVQILGKQRSKLGKKQIAVF